MLTLSNLILNLNERPLLKGIHLKMNPGEIHVLMGPNGAGKSTLAKSLAGHPHYVLSGGEATLNGTVLHTLAPEKRLQAGLFVSFQNPIEIPGVSTLRFLHLAVNTLRKAREEATMSLSQFEKWAHQKLSEYNLNPSLLKRALNEGLSGGEKKWNEFIQMILLEPKAIILDEMDSGLDIEAMQKLAPLLKQEAKGGKSLLLISHSPHFLRLLKPHYIHILSEGALIQSGGMELLETVETKGFCNT